MESNKPSVFKRSQLAFAVIAACLSNQVMANTLSGLISDVNQKVYFEGAKVELKELNKGVVSSRDGSYSFNNVPAGEYTLVVSYVGAQPQALMVKIDADLEQNIKLASANNLIEDMIVVGTRAGQAGAINRQKNALSIKSIVSSDSIGQLPDQNAAEALQRLPGMFIQRDQGEGRFVGIRGIDPNLNNVTINGANVPSPEAGVRSVAMDVIPSELVQSLEVSKSVTPDMDASAVGGSIDVKSLSAFDREGRSYSATFQGSYNEQVSEASPKLSASFTDVYEFENGSELGLATAFSWFERKFGSHNSEVDGGFGEISVEGQNSGDDVDFFGAEEIEQRHYLITRERLGAALNLDFRTNAHSEYYLRTLWSEFSDDEFRLRNEYKFAKGQVLEDSITSSSATFINADMDRDTKDRFEQQQILSVVLGGKNQLNDWLLEYDLGYSKSNEKEPNRIDADFKGEGFALGYNSTANAPDLAHSEAAHDLTNFELDEIVNENNLSEDSATSFKVDVSKDFVWQNHNGELKFGTKYQTREKTNNVNSIVYDGGFGDVLASQFESAEPDYSLGAFGPGLSKHALAQFVKTNKQQFEINRIDTEINSFGQTYQSEEDILAAFAMVTMDINQWHIVAGVRYEDTSFATAGNRVELTVDEINDDETVSIAPWTVEQDYNHFLPSLNIKYDFSEKLITRFAYTNTIARPTFGDSAAYQLIETEIVSDDGEITTERKAEVGNPDLKPYESMNLDASIEYYPGNIGVMSAGIFFKDIKNFIVMAEVQDTPAWQGFDEVIQPINGGSAQLTGIELAWTKNFKNGLMFSTNGTFINADDKLPNQSDTVANMMFGYESAKFSARISASYKSESYQYELADAAVFEDAHNQFDFSAKYYINEQSQVYFNAINITDEPFYLYHGSEKYSLQYETYGRSFELGFTFTSF
ncbi:TonB-dependent receptor [Pseudoalteromonas sp. G4]|uniref:TonB-dependent receptor n=1 Tax=Pseudoalteromonas sp. G4 TaxID=2992761 RepID=UPI00237E772B|nr:TonB-dependent receptor [Pseudoalteromonas sp. G4]MDE3271913.1 TonB-dependent receptor [Pseudoalteromonas sp. G4]